MQDNRIGMKQELIENIIENKNYSMQQGIGLIASNLQKITALSQNKPTDHLSLYKHDERNNIRTAFSHDFENDSPKQSAYKNRSLDANNLSQSQDLKISTVSNLIPKIGGNSPNMNASSSLNKLVKFDNDHQAQSSKIFKKYAFNFN